MYICNIFILFYFKLFIMIQPTSSKFMEQFAKIIANSYEKFGKQARDYLINEHIQKIESNSQNAGKGSLKGSNLLSAPAIESLSRLATHISPQQLDNSKSAFDIFLQKQNASQVLETVSKCDLQRKFISLTVSQKLQFLHEYVIRNEQVNKVVEAAFLHTLKEKKPLFVPSCFKEKKVCFSPSKVSSLTKRISKRERLNKKITLRARRMACYKPTSLQGDKKESLDISLQNHFEQANAVKKIESQAQVKEIKQETTNKEVRAQEEYHQKIKKVVAPQPKPMNFAALRSLYKQLQQEHR